MSTSEEKSRTCLACAAGTEKTRDGRHHPGFNGKRFYVCRARDQRPVYASTPRISEPCAAGCGRARLPREATCGKEECRSKFYPVPKSDDDIAAEHADRDAAIDHSSPRSHDTFDPSGEPEGYDP